jgi:glycosyltransferase involved in cell wall biosynthesis
MVKHTKVSVIIPTYNRAYPISRAIKSVLNQTHIANINKIFNKYNNKPIDEI